MIPYKGRFFWIFFSLPLIYLLLFLKLFQIQVLQKNFFSKKANSLHEISIKIHPKRGEITDRNGNILAADRQSYSIFYRKFSLPENKKLGKLASLLGYSKNALIGKISGKKFAYLQKGVDNELVEEIKKLKLKGLGWEKEFQRFYPSGDLAGPVLGFVGKDRKGLSGVELFYNKYLQEKKGVIKAEKDGRGRILPSSEWVVSPSRKGYTVKLTIDERFQYILEEELKSVHKEYNAKESAGILINPQTGEILAMASFPSFAPDSFWKYSPSRFKNRAISMVYEPGSTFKVITMASALEERVVSLKDRIFCENGKFLLYGRVIHDHEPFGILSIPEILWHSSNIGITKVAMKLGKNKLYRYIRKFGFGEKTGIDLPGEEEGIVRKPYEWSKASIGAIPYGQEIGVTPIQLTMAVGVIANGGYLLKPYIVKEIASDEKIILKRKKEVKRRVISTRTANLMKEMMAGVVKKGTGIKARITNYRIAGKTGTAQKYIPGKGYNSGKYIASFIGFLPVEKPRFLLLIVINEPEGLHYGGEIAAPCFKKVMERILSYQMLDKRRI